jgi:hypothetical protein
VGEVPANPVEFLEPFAAQGSGRALLAQPAPPVTPPESVRDVMLRLAGFDIERDYTFESAGRLEPDPQPPGLSRSPAPRMQDHPKMRQAYRPPSPSWRLR